jgi:hypothetical protein
MGTPVPPPDQYKKIIAQFWETANKMRDSGESPLYSFLKQSRDPIDPESLNAVAQIFGEWFTPHPVMLFAKELVTFRKPKNILDPNAGNGIFLASLVKVSKAKCLGLIKVSSELEKAKLLEPSPEVIWRLGDPLQFLDSTKEQFDAVVSNLPLGMRRRTLSLPWNGSTVEVNDEEGRLILLKSALNLSPTGIGTFVVSNSFFFQSNENSVRHVLPRFGLRVAGCFSIPAGAFRPLTSIGGILLVIEHGSSTQMFVGELSGDPERTALLADNFLTGKNGADLSLGRLVRTDSFQSYATLEEEDRLAKMAADFGVPRVALSEIAVELNLAKSEESFPERPNSVYLPLIGTSRAVTELSEGTIKPHNYIQIVVNEAVADSRYLAGFFNTPLGFSIRRSLCTGSVIPKISKGSLQQAIIFLPPREVQIQTVTGATTLAAAASQIKELETRLWSRPKYVASLLPVIQGLEKKESLPEWLDHLPFPLASILWTYHASGADPKVRYEHLLHFFEAVAEFMAIVFLSGFRSQPGVFEQERQNLALALKHGNLSVSQGTFGTWKTIVDYFSKRGRILLNGAASDFELCSSLFSCGNREVLEMLFSRTLVSLIQETNAHRNLWTGHGGIVGQEVAEERHAILLAALAKLRDVFGAIWDSVELVRPIGGRLKAGIFENQVDRLMGPRVPFERVERKTAMSLDADDLYLLPLYESRSLKLIPLVKIMPAPKTAQNACYFYNRRQKDQRIRFVSYHFEQEAEVIDQFSDTLEILQLISGS